MLSRWTTRFETWVVPKPNHPQRVWIQMPSRWTTRFETWVVPKPNHPQRVWIQMPSRWTTRFETWVVPKPNHPPLDVFGFKCKTVRPPNLRLEQIWSLKSPPNVFGFKCQTVEPPNLRFEQISSLKLSPPQRVWIQMPNRWTTQFETWTNLKSQITPLDVFGFKCQTVKPPDLRLEQIWSLKLSSSTCLDPGFQTIEPPNSGLEQISNLKLHPWRVWIQDSKPSKYSKLRFWTNFKSQFSQTVWKNFQTKSDLSIFQGPSES